MGRMTRDGFVERFSGDVAAGGIVVTPQLERRLESLGVDRARLRAVIGEDGVLSSEAELLRLFDLVDEVDHDGSRRSLELVTFDGEGEEMRTASGEAVEALSDEAMAARIGASLPGESAGDGELRASDQMIADLRRFEGMHRHMYLDTRGFVTTGIGHLLKDAASALKLPWRNSASGARATGEEVRTGYAAVAAMEKGRRASFYMQPGGLRLSEVTVVGLAKRRLDIEFLPGLRRTFPGFHRFPLEAQSALIDMVYNLGVAGLGTFRKLIDACNRGDFAAAAAESRRRGTRASRNEWTRTMFLTAAA